MADLRERVVATRLLWYAAGVTLLAAARILALRPAVRAGLSVAVVCGLVAVYALERVDVRGGVVASPALLALAVGGVAVGVGLTAWGRPTGLVFLAGGLLFLVRAIPVGREA